MCSGVVGRARRFVYCSCVLSLGFLTLALSACGSDYSVAGGGGGAGTSGSFDARELQEPAFVPTSEGEKILVYEILVENVEGAANKVYELSVEDASGARIATYSGSDLQAMTRVFGSGITKVEGDAIPEGGGALILIYLRFSEADDVLPTTLQHSLTLAGGDGDPVTTETFTVGIDRTPPVVVSAPVHGGRWIMDGAIGPASYHRSATLPLGGQFWVPERYAIDFEVIDDRGFFLDAAGDKPTAQEMANVENWHAYGLDVVSATAGTVVTVLDGLDDAIPPDPPTGLSEEQIGGNHVVVDMGDGNYAFYAHMIKGSIVVSVGDTLSVGDTIGKIGNTGNSFGPHLHFHVINGPDPLRGFGVPYVIDGYVDRGLAQGTPDDILGGTVSWDPDTPQTEITNRLPSINRVVDL